MTDVKLKVDAISDIDSAGIRTFVYIGDTSDELSNVLLGLKTLYQLKFERLFSTFEDCVSQRMLEGGNPHPAISVSENA